MNQIKRVIVETPFRSIDPVEQQANIEYARACARDCLLNHGEAPFLSHLLYTQQGVLDDQISNERQLGIDAGLGWGLVAEATIVYTDRGFSTGMTYGIQNAILAHRPIEYRTLPGYLDNISK